MATGHWKISFQEDKFTKCDFVSRVAYAKHSGNTKGSDLISVTSDHFLGDCQVERFGLITGRVVCASQQDAVTASYEVMQSSAAHLRFVVACK